MHDNGQGQSGSGRAGGGAAPGAGGPGWAGPPPWSQAAAAGPGCGPQAWAGPMGSPGWQHGWAAYGPGPSAAQWPGYAPGPSAGQGPGYGPGWGPGYAPGWGPGHGPGWGGNHPGAGPSGPGAQQGGSGLFAMLEHAPAGIGNLVRDDFTRGLLIGAAATLVATNPTVQQRTIRTAVQLWELVQDGLGEVRERFRDAEAEMQGENDGDAPSGERG